jgi:hypothetical protein
VSSPSACSTSCGPRHRRPLLTAGPGRGHRDSESKPDWIDLPAGRRSSTCRALPTFVSPSCLDPLRRRPRAVTSSSSDHHFAPP